MHATAQCHTLEGVGKLAVQSVEDTGVRVEMLIKPPPPKSLVLNVRKINDTPLTGERAENGQVMNTKQVCVQAAKSWSPTRPVQSTCLHL